ncbi:hypothetical protein A8A57_21960 [Lelliottia amnigena]|nr:hypothetical protein A8A57_21960 [Lelliottia amnigena]
MTYCCRERPYNHSSRSQTPIMASISFWISSLIIYHFGRVIILCNLNKRGSFSIQNAVNEIEI